MLNKKWLAIFMIMMMAAFGAFADDDEKEEKGEEEKSDFATGFFNFKEKSWIGVADGAFDGFYTKISKIEGGVNLNLVDDIGLVLAPVAGASDVKFSVGETPVVTITNPGIGVASPTFNWNEATIYTGLILALAPIDILGLEFALYNVDYFGDKAANLGAAAGLGFSVGLSLGVEDAFLDFEIADAIEATWSGVRGAAEDNMVATHLYNDFTYGLRFNFFNFIKDTLNTGLYIDGELEIDADWGNQNDDNGEHQGTALCNEFNIGLVTNPVKWFEGYVGFNMMNENVYQPEGENAAGDKTLWSLNSNRFGIKVGATFFYKCVSFDLNWIGYPGNFVKGADLYDKDTDWTDWTNLETFTQEIAFTVAVKLN